VGAEAPRQVPHAFTPKRRGCIGSGCAGDRVARVGENVCAGHDGEAGTRLAGAVAFILSASCTGGLSCWCTVRNVAAFAGPDAAGMLQAPHLFPRTRRALAAIGRAEGLLIAHGTAVMILYVESSASRGGHRRTRAQSIRVNLQDATPSCDHIAFSAIQWRGAAIAEHRNFPLLVTLFHNADEL
jgi:hypothetical protein